MTYIRLRDTLHHLALQGENGVVDAEALLAERSLTQAAWQQWLLVDIAPSLTDMAVNTAMSSWLWYDRHIILTTSSLELLA